MKRRLFFHILFFIFSIRAAFGEAQLQAINFGQKGEVSSLEFVFDSNEINANKFNITEDKQIILDIKDVKATERVLRSFDTSEFHGPLVYVSAYKKPGSENDLRVALQLRENVRSLLKRKEKRIVLELENRFGVFSQGMLLGSETKKEKDKVIPLKGKGKLRVPKSDSLEDILENLTLSGRKKYIGKKITLNVKNVSVEDILNMIAEASGFNIIITKEVQSLDPLSLNLVNIPWDQALDTILGLNKLVAKKNGIILLVQTQEAVAKEQEKELELKRKNIVLESLVTKVFPISFANPKDLEKILKEYSTQGRGKISIDERTNSMIVKDTAEVIEKLRKIIEVLDTQTAQVLIEAKITEVAESFSQEIGLRNGINFGYDPVGRLGDSLPGVVGGGIPSGADAGPGLSISSAPANTPDGVRNLFGLSISRFNRLTNLNFVLQLMESEAKGKVVSSPRVITQDKKKATFKSSQSEVFRTRAGGATATGVILEPEFKEVEVSLDLEVTPQITNEGSIVLEINVKKEDFGDRPFPDGPPKTTSNDIKTNVLVENGSTIVLGGLYEYSKREAHSGIPFLKDIPLIGWLFRTAHNPQKAKREVIIFMTPRIINQKEAGLVDNS